MTASTIRQALAAGLRWLYDTPQPDGAILQHHGEGLYLPDANRSLAFIPAGWDGKVVIVVNVARAGWKPERNELTPAHMIGPTEIDEVTAMLADLGARVVHTWNGHPSDTGSLALERPAHPTLLAAVNRYRKGCPDHPEKSVFCKCGWYERGNKKVAVPVLTREVTG
ncbi:hypothetical protein [Nocardiopsis synnemataformans]|uniref:hypothetical protein n=1 Tax=Nocardiopsis synnemataformans TaxID=61305 RepID=UPI003EBF8863